MCHFSKYILANLKCFNPADENWTVQEYWAENRIETVNNCLKSMDLTDNKYILVGCLALVTGDILESLDTQQITW